VELTNKFGYPEAIVSAMRHNPHPIAWGAVSVTQLCTPPRIYQLRKRHYRELKQDASDRVWTLWGSALHWVFQQAQVPGLLTEVFLDGYVGEGCRLSGIVDAFDLKTGELYDYKTTSAWAVVPRNGHGPGTLPEPKTDWVRQVNIYRWLAEQNNLHVKRLSICVLAKDWSAQRAGDGAYPVSPIITIPVKMWSVKEVENYIADRFALQITNKDVPDNQLPACTAEERWQDPDVWAVMKKGRKSSLKNCDTPEEARAVLARQPKPGLCYVEHRIGESKRCKSYCEVAEFCNLRDEFVRDAGGA